MSFELSPTDEPFLEFGDEFFPPSAFSISRLLLLPSSLLLQNLPRRFSFFLLLQLDNALWSTVVFLVPLFLLSTFLPFQTPSFQALPFQTVHFYLQLLLLIVSSPSPYHTFASPLFISFYSTTTPPKAFLVFPSVASSLCFFPAPNLSTYLFEHSLPLSLYILKLSLPFRCLYSERFARSAGLISFSSKPAVE